MKLKVLFTAVSVLALHHADAVSFIVVTTGDSGPGSLRQAIMDSNATNGDDTISFAVSGAITLASALPPIIDNTIISGPGTNLLTISGNNSSRVFTVNTQAVVTISSLTIADGRATGYTNGGGIANAGNLTISNCALINNQTFGGWAGAVFNSGDLRVVSSVFSGNQVTGESGFNNDARGWGTGGGGAGMGGGVFTMSGAAIIYGCSFISNSATGGNGGISGGSTGSGRGGGANGGIAGGSQQAGHNGGFGGGGGGGGSCEIGGAGGLGGGGGGGSFCPAGSPSGGVGGLGGGTGGSGAISCSASGGGGGGLGGGVFVHSGTVSIVDCYFTNNQTIGGLAGPTPVYSDGRPCANPASNGTGIGPDFFNSAGKILPALTANTPGGGAVAVEPLAPPYFANSLATVTATPAADWTLLQWMGDATGANPVINLHMNRNRFVQAVFGTTVSHAASITVSPQSAFYPYGTVVKLAATPPPGEFFVSWTGDASGTNNPMNFVITNPTPNISCQLAALNLGESSLTVVENGKGRVVVIPGKSRYAINETVGLIPVADLGQEFIGWSGDATGTQNPLLVSMVQSRVITAQFTKRPSLRVGTPLEGLTENGFRLTVLGEFGTPYTILGSTNLADWIAAGTVTNIYGTVQLTDPAATNLLRRFYRAASD